MGVGDVRVEGGFGGGGEVVGVVVGMGVGFVVAGVGVGV